MKTHPRVASPNRWSSAAAFYLGTAGAAVGLGSIWRFPYLAGSSGGSAFILVFILACGLIATPLLVAELALGRVSRHSPPQAAAVVASMHGLSRRWNAIGVMGALAAFLIFSYYTVIAGWVLAYTVKAAAGELSRAGPQGVAGQWQAFLAEPLAVGGWHVVFLILAGVISARGLQTGIEVANRIRGPGLLLLLSILVLYSLCTGDVQRGLTFAFRPQFAQIDAHVVLSAIGQAFYATGVGQAMMIAFGAYAAPGDSLIRTSLVISGSILLVSLLATLAIFPLVFAYGMNPAQGPQLVFEVLPRAFAEMPAGRFIGTLFFLLLTLAALMPSIASLEPVVAWLVQRWGLSRARAVWVGTAAAWVLGLGSVTSFSVGANWHPLHWIPGLEGATFFAVADFLSGSVLLPVGAVLTSLFMGWRLRRTLLAEIADSPGITRRACVWLLQYVCPAAIVAVFLATLT